MTHKASIETVGVAAQFISYYNFLICKNKIYNKRKSFFTQSVTHFVYGNVHNQTTMDLIQQSSEYHASLNIYKC